MTEICGCSISKTPNSTAVVSSNVTYDGSALSCMTFSSGDLNELADAINTAICLLQTAISNITLTSEDVTITDGIVADCTTVAENDTVTDAFNKIIAQLCLLETAVTDLDTDGMVTVDLTVPNCLSITNGMSLTDAIKAIITALCPTYSFVYADDIYTLYEHPINNYAKALPVVTDSSAGGVAKVDISATNYFVNNTNVVKAGETVSLVDNKDNYIYLDYTNGFDYAVEDVNIGAGTPTVTGEIVCFVTTGVGIVSAITDVITLTPIDNTLIADDAIKARNLYSDIAGDGLGISAGGVLSVNVDSSTIEINTDTLRVKADGITKSHINSDVAGDGLAQNVNGSLEVSVEKSINTVADKVSLVNDEASPDANKYYGTDSNGTKGFVDLPLIETDWIQIPTADVLTLRTTPITLVAAPTVGYYISVFKVEAVIEFNTIAYDNGTDLLLVGYETDPSTLYKFDNTFLESASGSFEEAQLSSGSRTLYARDAIVITTSSADPTAGNSDIYVKVYYKIQNIPY